MAMIRAQKTGASPEWAMGGGGGGGRPEVEDVMEESAEGMTEGKDNLGGSEGGGSTGGDRSILYSMLYIHLLHLVQQYSSKGDHN